VNQYLDQHFNRMERDIAKADFATKTRQRLVDSIKFMEQVKMVASFKPTATRTHKVYGEETMPLVTATIPKLVPVNVYNDKTET
jgi:hypothetical protein